MPLQSACTKCLSVLKHFIATFAQVIRITGGKRPRRIKPNVYHQTQLEDSLFFVTFKTQMDKFLGNLT